MKLDSIEYFLVDIDGTITDCQPNAMKPEFMLAKNFLFPIIRDMLVEDGWDYAMAGRAIANEAARIVYWDYSDFIVKFKLSKQKTFARMRQWHRDNLTCHEDMVETVKELAARGKKLFIISNNPYWGCRFKLEFAGLANPQEVLYFERIFGTNILNGCKESAAVWQRALDMLSIDPGRIATIGDSLREDGEVPQSCGIGCSFILNRKSKDILQHNGKSIFLRDARQILSDYE